MPKVTINQNEKCDERNISKNLPQNFLFWAMEFEELLRFSVHTMKIGFLQVLINGNAALKGRVITEVTNFFQTQLNMAIL